MSDKSSTHPSDGKTEHAKKSDFLNSAAEKLSLQSQAELKSGMPDKRTNNGHPGLPVLHIDGAGNKPSLPSYVHGASKVAEEFGKGAINEITHNPLRVAENVAVGALVGAGAVLLAPEAALALGVVGIGLAAGQVVSHAGEWCKDAAIVADSAKFSAKEVAKAKQGIENLGAGTVDNAAGLAGGIAGGWGTNLVRTQISKAAVSAAESTLASKVKPTEIDSPVTPPQQKPGDFARSSELECKPTESSKITTEKQAPPCEQKTESSKITTEKQAPKCEQKNESSPTSKKDSGDDLHKKAGLNDEDVHKINGERSRQNDAPSLKKSNKIKEGENAIPITEKEIKATKNKYWDEQHNSRSIEKGDPPTLDIVIGAPGSGKTMNFVGTLAEKYKAFVLEADDLRPLLPGYHPADGGIPFSESANSIVGAMISDLRSSAMKAGENIVWSIVGRNQNVLEIALADAAKFGYQVRVTFADISPEQAMRRTFERAFKGSGQWVDPEFAYRMAAEMRGAYEALRKSGLIDLANFRRFNMDGTKPQEVFDLPILQKEAG